MVRKLVFVEVVIEQPTVLEKVLAAAKQQVVEVIPVVSPLVEAQESKVA